MVHHVFQERNVRLHPANAELPQAAVHPLTGVPELAPPRRHLHEQRIVIRRNHRAAIRRRPVQPYAETRRRAVRMNPSVIRHEPVRRVLRRHPALHREPIHQHVFLLRQVHLGVVQFQSLRNLNLRPHDVDAGHHLGYRVLHLHPRIHLDEEPLPRIRVHQKFHRRRVEILRLPRQLHRGIGQPLADSRIQMHRRRHFHHFLIPPLHRTIALVQMQHVAERVGQNLHLDVPRPPDEALQKHRVVSERRARLLPRLLQTRLQRLGVAHHPHPAPAPSERRLHNQRIPDSIGDGPRVVFSRHRLPRSRHHRNSRPLRHLPRRRLVAQQIQQFRARPDEGDPRFRARLRQRRVLRQKSIPRMDRVHALFLGECYNTVNVEVSLHRPHVLANRIGLVGLETMQAQPVLLRINRHGAQSQFVRGAEDADSDFASVQSKQFFHWKRRVTRLKY